MNVSLVDCHRNELRVAEVSKSLLPGANGLRVWSAKVKRGGCCFVRLDVTLPLQTGVSQCCDFVKRLMGWDPGWGDCGGCKLQK